MNLLRGRALTSTGIVYVVLVAAVLVGAVLTFVVKDRNFFAGGNITAILTFASILGLVAIGQTLVILVGSLDLSVPYVISLACVIGARQMDGDNANILSAVLIALAVSAAIGAVNGLVVAILGVHGFIATLGMALILGGYIAARIEGDQGRVAPTFAKLDTAELGPVPAEALVMLGCALLAVLLLRRTRLGHHMYAVGGNREVARLSGIRTAVPVVAAHTLCSTLAGLAGLMLLTRVSVGKASIGLSGNYDLMSIAAVVLGGTLLAGGKGNVTGTVGGVLIFAVMDQVMSVIAVPPFVQDVVRGLVIVLAVAVYARREIDRRPAPFDRPTGLDAALQESR
jgi:ribose transport system permease protein